MSTLYPKLALTGMAKNKQLYIPYFFACSLLMMVFYITAYLADSEIVADQPGGSMISVVLDSGWIILTAFSALFMFYMSSFLLKRRKTEFGLYNVLGMGKSNIMLVLVCEIGMVFIGSFLLGTGLGVLFSKLVESLLIKLLGGENTYEFSVNGLVVVEEFCGFLALFGIILVRGMRQIRLNNSIQLLCSQNLGDEPPKANLFLTILGIVLLTAGYVLANIVESWIWAILAFFGAVLLVIAATYILFVSGSTIVCKLLKKNPRFYYKKNHFFAVSQISSRMKKNGAGLASICILSTMVLVSFSAVGGLYFGAERILRNKYPRDAAFCFDCDDGELVSEYEQTILDTAGEKGVKTKNIVRYRYIYNRKDDTFFYHNNKLLTREMAEKLTEEEKEKIADLPLTQFYYVPISDYNAVMGKNLSVNRGEALVLRMRSEKKNDFYDLIPVKGEVYTQDIYDVNGELTETKKQCDIDYFKCTGSVGDFVVYDGDVLNEDVLNDFSDSGEQNRIIYRYVFLNDEDFEQQYQRRVSLREVIEVYVNDLYEIRTVMSYYFGADVDCDQDTMDEIFSEVMEKEDKFYTFRFKKDGKGYFYGNHANLNTVFEEREEFYLKSKSILFLGAMFCAVFIAAALLMMYYKQITEGHEDKARFCILRQVGMTDREVRSTINSQVLIMFFMPLIAAGVHTLFAFGLISKLIMLFGDINLGFLALVTLICFLGYAAIYTIAYRLTSRVYYRIIS